MVSDAHGHVHGVHELADVVRMHTVDGECNDADTIDVRVRAEDLNAVDRRDSIEHHGRERVLVGFHAVHAECRQVAQGLGPCGDLCDGLRSCFEALGRSHESRFLHGHPFDHRSARQDRRHRSQQCATPPQGTGTRGPEHLVRRKHRKVHVERGQVERHMRAGLARVKEDQCSDSPSGRSHGRNG